MEKIAEILFENTDKIPEGLYLELMNNLTKPNITEQTRIMQNIDMYACGYKDAIGRFPPKEKVVEFLMDNYSCSGDPRATFTTFVDIVWTIYEQQIQESIQIQEPVHDDTIKCRIKDIIKVAFYTMFFALLI
jgi:hypothetical protein